LKQARLENGFYSIINGERVSAGKTFSVVNPATGGQLGILPDADRAFLNKATGAARNAFPGWSVVPFGRRKTILATLLNKIDDHADELSALLTAEQGGLLARAEWEIDLHLTSPDIVPSCAEARETDPRNGVAKQELFICAPERNTLRILQFNSSLGNCPQN
jgi:acyl-CoA reductase-like NAD-dependent aldehyde dehydrogenase